MAKCAPGPADPTIKATSMLLKDSQAIFVPEISNHTYPPTKKIALDIGSTHFFTGVPCKNAGHISLRKTATSGCVACSRERSLRYDSAHREHIREIRNDRYSKNVLKERASSIKTYKKRYADAEKRQKILINMRTRRKDNGNLYSIRRRARIKGAQGSYTKADIRSLMSTQNTTCAGCLESIQHSFHVDHIVPLARGGSNYIQNIQLLCVDCNLGKSAKHPMEWAKEKDFTHLLERFQDALNFHSMAPYSDQDIAHTPLYRSTMTVESIGVIQA